MTYTVTCGPLDPALAASLLIDTDDRQKALDVFDARVADLTGHYGYRIRESEGFSMASIEVRLRHPRTHQWLRVIFTEV